MNDYTTILEIVLTLLFGAFVYFAKRLVDSLDTIGKGLNKLEIKFGMNTAKCLQAHLEIDREEDEVRKDIKEIEHTIESHGQKISVLESRMEKK